MMDDFGIINLDDRYCIDIDNLNCTLKEMKTIKTGKHEGEKFADPVGYYNTITEALEAYADRIIRDQMKGKSLCSSSYFLGEKYGT